MKQTIYILMVAMMVGMVSAAIPYEINHNFRIRNTTSGVAINSSIALSYNIYSTATGGSSLATINKTVTPYNGIVSVNIPVTLPFNMPYYAGVRVNGGSEMTPRINLTSAPYSYYANQSYTMNWTGLQNYPTACSAGNYISGVGDTLTCSPFSSVYSSSNLTVAGINLVNLSRNSYIDGEVFGVTMTNPPGNEIPHFWVQSGGATQASGIARSFMIVNEYETLLNSVDRTSCSAWATYYGEDLKIDCNTTTTGADLFVGDDMQVIGDVWIQDTDSEWHYMTRELSLRDQMTKNTFENIVNASISGTTLSIVDHQNENFVVISDENNRLMTVSSGSVSLTAGTNASPQFNQVYWSSATTPVLTVSTTEIDDVPDVAQILLGQNYEYAGIASSAHNEEFIRGVYHRFWDSGAIYKTGFTINASGSIINISTGTMKVMLDDITTTNTLNTNTKFIYITNAGVFNQYTSLNSISTYQSGETVSANRYYNIVCGVTADVSKQGRLYCVPQNKPATEYTSVALAEQDNYQTINYFPQDDFVKQLFIPVVRVVVQRSGGTNVIQTLTSGQTYYDLRGSVTTSAGSNPISGITDHGLLSGLTDDDHTLYLLASGGRNVTTLNVSNNLRTFGNLFMAKTTFGFDSSGNLRANANSINGTEIDESTLSGTASSLTVGDLSCSDCIGGTEIAELTDADISNTLTASTWDGETSQSNLNVNSSANAWALEGTDFGTLTNGYYCTYDSANTEVDCNSQYTIASDLTCTDCIGTTEIADSYLLNNGDTGTENYIFQKNVTVEMINFEQDTTNHRMYDNSTCVIIRGDTGTLSIC